MHGIIRPCLRCPLVGDLEHLASAISGLRSRADAGRQALREKRSFDGRIRAEREAEHFLSRHAKP